MVRLKKEKKEQLACLIRKTNKKFIKIRNLAQIIGEKVAALPGSRFGALYYRRLGRVTKISGAVCKNVSIIMKHMQSYFKNQLTN